MKDTNHFPESWADCSLADIVVINPKNDANAEQVAGFVPMALAPTNYHGTLKYEEKLWGEIKKSYTNFANGDVIFAKVTPCFENGKAAIVREMPNGIGAGSSEFYVLRPANKEISSKLIFAIIKTQTFMQLGAENMTGAVGLRRVPRAFVETFPIALPSSAEQKAIADKLDTLLAQVEATQARLERIPQILKRFRQSVLAAAVSGKLTEEWRALHDLGEDSWSSMPLKNIAEVLDPNPSHRYPKPEYGGIPILSTQQFDGDSGWTTDKAKHVSRDFFNERKGKCGFYEDDIIFARKGRLGLARFAPKGFDYVYSHTVFIVRPYKNVNPAFLLWSLRPDSVVDSLLMAMNSNTGVPTLGKGVFEKMEVHVPSPEEQTEIVRRVDELFAHADRIEQQANNALARVNNLTQSILAKAFRGELTEQWRKDNPELISGENSAEALLERIQAERAAVAGKKKPRKVVKKAANGD